MSGTLLKSRLIICIMQKHCASGTATAERVIKAFLPQQAGVHFLEYISWLQIQRAFHKDLCMRVNAKIWAGPHKPREVGVMHAARVEWM